MRAEDKYKSNKGKVSKMQGRNYRPVRRENRENLGNVWMFFRSRMLYLIWRKWKRRGRCGQIMFPIWLCLNH